MEHKSTQTREADVTFTMRGTNDEIVKEKKYTTRNLPQIDFRGRNIIDPRNVDFARIVAFELELIPENKRLAAYSSIFGCIQKIQTEESADVVSSRESEKKTLKSKVFQNVKNMYGDVK